MPNKYVSLDAACDIIKQEIEKPYIKEAVSQYRAGFMGAVRVLCDDVPAADVAPVVRCKECRFFGATQSSLCDMHHRAAEKNDYCNYGVRTDGGEPHD